VTATLVPLGRRLTAVLDTGTHPATGQPTIPDRTCGDCAHHNARPRPDARTKCELADAPRGGPNLPTHTPGCVLHEPATDARCA
jgi:hypothetical protein